MLAAWLAGPLQTISPRAEEQWTLMPHQLSPRLAAPALSLSCPEGKQALSDPDPAKISQDASVLCVPCPVDINALNIQCDLKQFEFNRMLYYVKLFGLRSRSP